MAQHLDLFFPAVESIAVNNLPNNSVIFQDINVNFIIAVIPKTWTDTNGVVNYVFEVWYQQTQMLTYTTYLFPRGSGQTVSVFLTIVNTQTSSDNNLTQYTDWVALNRRPTGAARNILLNDDFIEKKVYRPAANETDMYVGVRQALDQEIFTCSGDQGKSWDYYYAYGE